MFFFLACIPKEPFPEPGNPISTHVLLFYVVKAEALSARPPLRGKMKLASLKRDFFIYPANWVPRIAIFCSEG